MAKQAPQAAIFGRSIDLATVGLLSLVLLVPLMMFPSIEGLLTGAALASTLHILINFPHFIASYRIIYASKERILRYKSATIVVPAILLLWSIFALSQSFTNGLWVHLLVVVSGLYIGIHYTGQTWGMMAVHTHLAGERFDDRERRLIRASLYLLAIFHATMFAKFSAQLTGALVFGVHYLYLVSSILAPLGLLLSALGIASYRRRTGKLPPAGAMVAWLSIYVWYGVLATVEAGAFWVQVAHSLQYLIFPARMFANERDARPTKLSRHPMVTFALWYTPLLVGGYFAFNMVPDLLISGMAVFNAPREVFLEWARLTPIVVSAFLNIHHFYTDGAIWKLRDPGVRDALFAHLKPAEKNDSQPKQAATTAKAS